MIPELPKLIAGGSHTDERGTVSFINEFDMSAVKRTYLITHPSTATIRAWQGHKREQKWFYVLEGKFKIVLGVPDNWDNPSEQLETTVFLLEASVPSVLHVPGGYINGFQAMLPNSKMMVFSDTTVEESRMDDYRFEKSRWYQW